MLLQVLGLSLHILAGLVFALDRISHDWQNLIPRLRYILNVSIGTEPKRAKVSFVLSLFSAIALFIIYYLFVPTTLPLYAKIIFIIIIFFCSYPYLLAFRFIMRHLRILGETHRSIIKHNESIYIYGNLLILFLSITLMYLATLLVPSVVSYNVDGIGLMALQLLLMIILTFFLSFIFVAFIASASFLFISVLLFLINYMATRPSKEFWIYVLVLWLTGSILLLIDATSV